MKKLYLLRGCPGSGKSTLAREMVDSGLAKVDLASDYFFTDTDGNYNWDAKYIREAHEWCLNQTEFWMGYNDNIVVHNTLTTEREMKPYFELAEKYGYSVTSVIVENRHGNIDVHSVPDEAKERMKNRFQVKLL